MELPVIKINKRKQELLQYVHSSDPIFAINTSEEYNKMTEFCKSFNIKISETITSQNNNFPLFLSFKLGNTYLGSSTAITSLHSFNIILKTEGVRSYYANEIVENNATDTFLLEDPGKSYTKLIFIKEVDICTKEIKLNYFRRPTGTSIAEIDKIELIEKYKKILEDD